MRLFNGRMIVHCGGRDAGATDVNDRDKYDRTEPRLFAIYGTTGK